MKKLLFIAAIFSSTTLLAQQNALKINILSPIVKTINVSFEHALSESGSLQLGVFYTGASAGDYVYRGFGITPEYRIYLSETPAIEGVYLAPFVRYQKINQDWDEGGYDADLSSIGGGLVIGKQWVFKEKITLDIFLGPSYSSASVTVNEGDTEAEINGAFSGFGLRTGITLGIAF